MSGKFQPLESHPLGANLQYLIAELYFKMFYSNTTFSYVGKKEGWKFSLSSLPGTVQQVT